MTKSMVLRGALALLDEEFRFERKLLAEIAAEYERLGPQYDRAEASVGPMRAVMERIYRRALRAPIPADTHPARFP